MTGRSAPTGPSDSPDPTGSADLTRAPGSSPTSAAGSSRPLAAAVTNALAARAAATEPDRRDDARDRLLAVLLDDPQRVVGAVVDLRRCQERIGRPTVNVHDERGRLGDVLIELAHAGLSTQQLAHLSGLPAESVVELLGRGVSG